MNELEKKAFKVLEEINEDIEMEVTLSEEVLNEGMILNAITDIFSGKGENVADGTKEVDSNQIGTIKKNSRWFLRSLDYLIPGFSESLKGDMKRVNFLLRVLVIIFDISMKKEGTAHLKTLLLKAEKMKEQMDGNVTPEEEPDDSQKDTVNLNV
jgi:hypothetical protein